MSWFSESAKVLLLANTVVQFLLFFDGVLSYGANVRPLETQQKGVGVLVASDETDAAAGGATSISFNLEFSKTSRSAEIYLVDNIGRVPGFYDQTYKQKVGVQMRRVQRNSQSTNATLNSYYQWPAAGIRGWSEDVALADHIFGQSIWVDIAIDRQVLRQPVVQIYDASRQTPLFTGDFNGRADYSLRPKVEYRVISDMPFSVLSVLSFIGQDTAQRWHEEYARNYSTSTPSVPTIRINDDDMTTAPTTTINPNAGQPIIIQFADYNDANKEVGDSKKAPITPLPIVSTTSVSQTTVAPGKDDHDSGHGTTQPTSRTIYESWLPPPTWLLITSGCLLFFLFIVFTGTVLYLCSRRPGFIFVTEEDATLNNIQNKKYQPHLGATYSGSSSVSPSMSPRPTVGATLRYPHHHHHHHHHGTSGSDDAHGSTSPMMPESPDEADLGREEQPLPLPPTNPKMPSVVYRYPPASSNGQRAGLVVTYADGLVGDDDDEDVYNTETLPRRQQVLFAPSTKR